MADEFDALNERLRDRLDSMTDDEFVGRIAGAAAVARAAATRKRQGKPCWCGNPENGHAGWLDCARRAAPTPSPTRREASEQ